MAPARTPSTHQPTSGNHKSQHPDLDEAVQAAIDDPGTWYETPAWGKTGNTANLHGHVKSRAAKALGVEVSVRNGTIYLRINS